MSRGILPPHGKVFLLLPSDSGFLSPDRNPPGFGLLENSFADLLVRLYGNGQHEDEVLFGLLAATLLLESRQGNVVCHLERLAGKPVPSGRPGSPEIYPDPFLFLLSCSRLNAQTAPFPIVFDREGKRVWLLRYRELEERIARTLTSRANIRDPLEQNSEKSIFLDRVFGEDSPENTIRRSANIVFHRKLLILSGGPGTGKTTALSRILACCPSRLSIPPERIALAAPTGKAAARLGESLAKLVPDLPDQDDREYLSKIPSPMTVHRLISQAKRDREQNLLPLPVDLLVVDEMSMVDLSLFDKLLLVLPEEAILILSGDPGQLSSVAPGAVFGEILKGPEESVAGSGEALSGSIVILKKSYRFSGESGVGQLSRWIRDGGVTPLDPDSLTGVEFRQGASLSDFYQDVTRDFSPYMKAKDLSGAFSALSGLGVLSPLRNGQRGVVEISRNLEQILFSSPRRSSERSHRGHPVVVLKNSSDLDLSNGDVGIIPFPWWGDPGRVCFSRGGGGEKTVPIEILPPWESALALTVHKSQGSEFSKVHLLLPRLFHPFLTRELLYTAVTRARESLVIWGDFPVFLEGVHHQSTRHSALGDFLWSPSSIV